MEVSGQLHVPAALLPGKSPRYKLDRGLGEPHSRSGRGDENKKFWPRFSGRPARCQAKTLTKYLEENLYTGMQLYTDN
jgi:hypothetical protein